MSPSSGAGRLPGDVAPEGWVTIPPDLAVEVVSPNDRVYELDEAGRLSQGERTARLGDQSGIAHRDSLPLDGPIRLLFEDDELRGEDIIPGFRCAIAGNPPAAQQGGAYPTGAG